MSKEIMKQVNGVEQAVTDVVDTVEEYATVLANVVGTIVSDIEAIVKAIIELIEMFFHLEDIIKLTKSFVSLFDDMANGTNGQGFPDLAVEELDGLFDYVQNALDSWSDDVDSVDLSDVQTTPPSPTGQFSTMQAHPFLKKAIGKVVGGAETSSDQAIESSTALVTFNFDLGGEINTLVQDFMTYLDDMGSIVTTAADALTSDSEQIAEDIANHLDNPQEVVAKLFQLFGPIANDLGTLVEQSLEDLLTFVESVVNDAGKIALQLVTTNEPFMTINPSAIADFWELLGVGKVGSDNKLGVTVSETIFLPIATLSWVVHYVATGNSATTTGEIWAPLTQQSESSANIASNDDMWNATVAACIIGFGAFQIGTWSEAAASSEQGPTTTLFLSYFLSLLVQTVETIQATVAAAGGPTDSVTIFDLTMDYLDFLWDVISTIVTIPSLSVADGDLLATGFDGLQSLFTLVNIGVDASDIGSSSSDKAAYAGEVILDVVGPGELIAGETATAELIPYVASVLYVLTLTGALVQVAAENDVDSPGPDSGGPGRTPPGQRRRPLVPPGLHNRSPLPPGQRRRPATPPGQEHRGDSSPRRRGREDT